MTPPANPGNLDDMPSSGQNSTDFLGAGVQKKLSGRKNTSWKIGGWFSKIFPCARQMMLFEGPFQGHEKFINEANELV